MARKSQRVAQQQAGTWRAEPETIAAAGIDQGSQDEHVVVFQIADGSFGFRLDAVGEIVRVPRLARMPLGPRSLLGLANLRGVVLPVVSLRLLLGFPDAPSDDATRVIVIDRGVPVGFVVDRIDDLLALSADRVETDDAGAGSIDPDLLEGVVKGAEGDSTIKILNPQRLLRDEFAALSASAPHAATGASVSPTVPGTTEF